ncbi:MAG: hypothetical protein ACFE9Q_11355 [Candidatus Hodarchaeota archaeon]
MVKTYIRADEHSISQRKNKLKKVEKTEEEDGQKNKYFDIWDVNPSFKDINNVLTIVKTIFLSVLTFSVILSSYIINHNPLISTVIGIFLLCIFIVVFHDQFFLLRNLFSFTFANKTIFNPFEHLVFWYDRNEYSTLYCTDRNDLTHLVLRIFEVKVIPQNIHPTIKQFIKALSSKRIRIPFSYQVIQKPIINVFDKESTRYSSLRSIESFTTSIYFSIFYHCKGILTEKKLERMRYYIKKYTNTLKSNFVANFHHFKIILLSDTALINALRTFFIKEEVTTSIGLVNKKKLLNGNSFSILRKALFIIVIIVYFDYILFSISINMIYVICINCLISIGFLMIWWRAVFFQITKSKLLHTENCVLVDPFKNIHFYKLREFPFSLFLQINNHLLLGLKMVNLKYILKSPFCLAEKFFESLNNYKLSFSYTLRNKPIGYYEFYKHGLNYVHEETQQKLLWKEIKNDADAEEWLGYQLGMWYSILTMSVNSYKFITTIKRENFNELEEDLTYKIESLKDAFNLHFQNYRIEDLRSQKLLSGYLFSILKNNHFRLNGTQLYELMVQGINLAPLTTVVDLLKKGVITKIAAEFNTPLYLQNFIIIGHTVNTEVLESEVPVGFTEEQIKSLLIVNGMPIHRELVAMKIVAELIKVGVPCLIFDFNGLWSILLDYFKNSQLINRILYFKLGSAFTIDPLISDIPYEEDNAEYLEYMFDAFGMAFQKDQRIIDMLRNMIKKNPDMDLKSIELDMQTLNDWQKNPINDSLLAVFSDFTHQDLSFFQNISGKDRIHANDFVKTDKTVIIDLSGLRDLDKKTFSTFLIIAKIIHYIKHRDEFHKKIIFIPNVDIFFNANFLDWKMNYGKINTFLDPLIHHEFGLVFSANQIRYLHSHLFNYFNNIISFRATDKRDIATLKAQMNLQELYGTGYYTSKRNNTYQIDYLMNMKNNEILVRRDDIYQPFPVVVDWNNIKSRKILPYGEIVEFMQDQGYNLTQSERRILEQAKKTIFEKDLGRYFPYRNEIISFLSEVQNFDQIGNLYKQKIKKHLKEILYPRISQKTNKKEHINKIRDDIFNLLVKHGYLVENHPKRASGSEALRTSYSVGDQYQRALEDYFEAKSRADSENQVDVIEKEIQKSEDLTNIFRPKPRKYIIQKENLKDAFAREFSDFNYDIFKIFRFINHNDYEKAIKIGHGLIKKYLLNVYKQFYNVNQILSINEVEKFIINLAKSEEFPFSKEEFESYIEKYDLINLENQNLEELAEDLYEYIYSFFIKIQNYIFEE